MLTARQIDARIRRMVSWNISPADIAARLQVSFQRVNRVIRTTAAEPADAQEYVPADSELTVQLPAPAADPTEAIAFLRAKGHQVHVFADGTYLLNDRDASATDLIARAQRIRERLAAGGGR